MNTFRLVALALALVLFSSTAAWSKPQYIAHTPTVKVGKHLADCNLSLPGENAVILTWKHLRADGSILRTEEILPAGFTPFHVADVGNGRLAVGGKSSMSGNTVIQVWELREPLVVLLYPSGEPTLSPRGRSRIITFQDNQNVGQQDVVWIERFHKEQLRFLVQYQSGHIWEHSQDPLPPKLVCSPDGSSGSFQVPLSLFYQTLMTRDHVDVGQFIILTSSSSSEEDYLLLDANRDGKLDNAYVLPEALRDSMGLDDPSKIIF